MNTDRKGKNRQGRHGSAKGSRSPVGLSEKILQKQKQLRTTWSFRIALFLFLQYFFRESAYGAAAAAYPHISFHLPIALHSVPLCLCG